jgi:hypothetical protein
VANDIEEVGRYRTSAKGPQADVDEVLFRKKWEVLAKKRTGQPLDSIGALLLGIVFNKNIEPDSYSKARHRDHALQPRSRDEKLKKE